MAYLNKIKKHSITIIGILIVMLGIMCVILYVTRDFGYKHLQSSSKVIQQQSEALMRGDIVLSHNIEDLKYDMVLHNNSVSQVWGLGVPFLRTPFYILGKLIGVKTVPEGLIHIFYFGLSICSAGIATYIFCRRFMYKEYRVLVPFVMMCVGLFAPVLMLMKSRFVVYEEVITYGYFFICTLFSLLLVYHVYPRSRALFYTICILCGTTGFVRPTLYAYALPIMFVALYYAWKHLAHRVVYIGTGMALVGGMLLLVTNHMRFGSAFEFGHGVNVALDSVSVNLTRFDSAYTTETPFMDKIQETFAILFFIDTVPVMNGLYMEHQTLFQTEAIRWRHIIFPTIHWYYLGAFIALGIVAVRQKSLLYVVPLVSFAMLFVFYSQSFIISSRYLIDFAASFAIASILALLYAFRSRSVWQKVCIALIIAGMYMYGAYSDISFVPETSTAKAVPISKKSINPELPDVYQIGSEPGFSYFNGAGWSSHNGAVRASIIFFVDNPQFIELEFICDNPQCVGFEHTINAVLDGENLKNKRVEYVGSSTIVRFEAKNASLSNSIKTIFIQTFFVRDSITVPSLMLKKMQWK